MSYDPHDTVAAVATAPGCAARGVVRISGPRAVEIATEVFAPHDARALCDVRRPTAISGSADVVLGQRRSVVPCNLILWPGTHSYTRQPLAEFHVPGSTPILDALVERLCACGARMAEPGEFTLRAFLAGRIDLTQAEAVLGVIDSHSASDYRTALAQLAGGLARPLDALRHDLIQLLAELEAGLDFVDEDIEFIPREEVSRRLASVHEAVVAIERQLAGRRESPSNCQVVLLGPPNVGKSSLFNAMVERYGTSARPAGAIVSAMSGTTRDYLMAELDLGGMHCQLIDTAGLIDEAVDDPAIHLAAQAHSMDRGRLSTLRLICTDERRTQLETDETSGPPAILVVTKADFGIPPDEIFSDVHHDDSATRVIVTSSHTGEGLDELAAAIRSVLVGADEAIRGGAVATTAIRCHESLRLATESLATARQLAEGDCGDELIAAEVRAALNELGKVVGAVSTDDLLDRIFSSFCIGK